MKRMLKYLLFAIVFTALCNCTDTHVSAFADSSSSAVSFEDTSYQSAVSESEPELCLPRQISCAGHNRVQNATRRTVGTGRSGITFTKSGSLINACTIYFLQKRSLMLHSTLMEPAHRLLCLGKLII